MKKAFSLVQVKSIWKLINKFSTSSVVKIDKKTHKLTDRLKKTNRASSASVHSNLNEKLDDEKPTFLDMNKNLYSLFKYDQEFRTENGGVLPQVEVAYETWGELNETKSNAILVFTGVSGDSHAKSTKVCHT